MINFGQAYTIFQNLDSDEYTDEAKGLAIYMIMNLDTHNGVKKADILKALKWLWHKHFEYVGVNTEE